MRLMASCGVSYCTIWFKKDDYSPYWIPHQPVEGWPILVASGLATPRLGSPGHKWELAWNISKWTLLDRNLPGTTLCCTSRFQPRDPTMLWYRKKSSAWHELDSRIPSFKGHGIMIPWVVPFSSHPGCLQGSPEAVVSAVGSDLGESPFYGRSNMWNMIIHGWSLAPIATVARFPAPSALAPVHVFHAHHDCLRGFGLGTAHGIYFRHFLNLELFDLGQLKSYQSLRQVLGGNYAASTVPTKLFRLKASKLHRALNHLVIWQSLQGQLLHEFNRWMDKNTIAIAHCIFIPVIPKPALGVLQMFFPSTATISMKWPESYGFVWK